jgi:dipeptidyl-peptidase 4
MYRGLAKTIAALSLVLGMGLSASAQDRLKTMPGYAQYQKVSRELPSAVKLGALRVTWKDGGKALEYSWDGKVYRYDIAERKAKVIGESKRDSKQPFPKQSKGGRGKSGGVARGRQAESATSPDGKLKAAYRDHNLWISDAKGSDPKPITTDGNAKTRIKYGTGSWVYGEELYQNTAIWWSPDSKKVAYYRFDESQVPDYFLTLAQTSLHDKLQAEPYPKAGDPNPVVDLFVYDVATKKSQPIDVRDGKVGNRVVGHYVYHVSWSPDGKELLFYRTNRRQNIMEFVAANPETGVCRVIVREEWLPSWVANAPAMQFLRDGKRFVWASERAGWRNLYLYELSGRLLASLTHHEFEVASIAHVDEEAGQIYYLAHSGDNPMKLQLHRVGLDGLGEVRLTDPAFHHTVDVAPDGEHFVDIAQTHDQPPVTRLFDTEGYLVAELAHSDMSKFDKLGLQRVEVFTFKAADGITDLYGLLHRPSQFDARKKYPLLVSVYAGPATNGARETFTLPSALTELGFLVATLDARSAAGRGKRSLDAIYLKLGGPEIDDQAAGVRFLAKRPYVDGSRVGIFGGSYGGYTSLLCLLRHPDVFQAACASSPVTDFRLYDSIYTERYLWLPEENKAGYDAGSALTHAAKLRGRLMIYFGTADDNVHPANSLQLIRALQRAGKNFEVQVGPDLGHGGISQQRMMEFFIESLKESTDDMDDTEE